MAKAKSSSAKRRVGKSKKTQITLIDRILANKFKLAAALVLLMFVPFAVVTLTNDSGDSGEQQVQAHEGEDDSENAVAQSEEQSGNVEEGSSENQEAAYNYEAQPGDTYSQIARKAVQTYGVNNDVNLSQAQIIYAETMLTQEAGSPLLNEGQELSVKESTVKNWVDKANELTDAQKAAWAVYAVGVDFNTDSVGE